MKHSRRRILQTPYFPWLFPPLSRKRMTAARFWKSSEELYMPAEILPADRISSISRSQRDFFRTNLNNVHIVRRKTRTRRTSYAGYYRNFIWPRLFNRRHYPPGIHIFSEFWTLIFQGFSLSHFLKSPHLFIVLRQCEQIFCLIFVNYFPCTALDKFPQKWALRAFS